MCFTTSSCSSRNAVLCMSTFQKLIYFFKCHMDTLVRRSAWDIDLPYLPALFSRINWGKFFENCLFEKLVYSRDFLGYFIQCLICHLSSQFTRTDKDLHFFLFFNFLKGVVSEGAQLTSPHQCFPVIFPHAVRDIS